MLKYTKDRLGKKDDKSNDTDTKENKTQMVEKTEKEKTGTENENWFWNSVCVNDFIGSYKSSKSRDTEFSIC